MSKFHVVSNDKEIKYEIATVSQSQDANMESYLTFMKSFPWQTEALWSKDGMKEVSEMEDFKVRFIWTAGRNLSNGKRHI